MDKYFKDVSVANGTICSSFHFGDSSADSKRDRIKTTSSNRPQPTTSGVSELTKTQLRKRREARYMTKSILPKVSKKGKINYFKIDEDMSGRFDCQKDYAVIS